MRNLDLFNKNACLRVFDSRDICPTPTNKQKNSKILNENLIGFDIYEITVSTIIVDMYV